MPACRTKRCRQTRSRTTRTTRLGRCATATRTRNEPISETEREELVDDLADLAVYQALLEPRGVRGIVVDCGDCDEPHYHDWALLRASLEQLLHDGRMRPHEPAFDPNPRSYVSWEYCRGFADGVTATESAR